MPAISRAFFLPNTLESVIIPPVFGMSPTLGTDSKAPSLRRYYPTSPVLRASPPPCRPDSALTGCRLARATPPVRASRVASILLFHACCRQYPGGTRRCLCRSLADGWQPSPLSGRVGFRITGFEACSTFTHVAVAVGKRVTLLPPHRSPHARWGTGLLPRVFHGKTLRRPRVPDLDEWPIQCGNAHDIGDRGSILL